jgi:undecaprenyl-diphosphatase
MEIWQSLVMGVVEGLTEFLPISSTGHLILAGHVLGVTASDFAKSFEIIIQLGAILAVVVLYFKTLWSVANIKKLLVAFAPTAVIGLALYKVVKAQLLGNEAVVLWALGIGGVLLIIFELVYKSKRGAVPDENEGAGIESVTYKQAFLIGLAQSLAIIPGVSRSAATIVGGLLLGLSRQTIVEFSFLLAVPTMLAASGLDLVKNAGSFSADQFGVLTVGFVVAFVTALVAIKFLLSYIRTHSFIPFGIYRIAIAILFALVLL